MSSFDKPLNYLCVAFFFFFKQEKGKPCNLETCVFEVILNLFIGMCVAILLSASFQPYAKPIRYSHARLCLVQPKGNCLQVFQQKGFVTPCPGLRLNSTNFVQ